MSKINPNKKAYSLIDRDFKKIMVNSKKVLFKAIKNGGSTIKDFKNTFEKKVIFKKILMFMKEMG